MQRYHWGELAKKYIETYPEQNLELFKLIMSHLYNWDIMSLKSNSTFHSIAARIAKENPAETWEIVQNFLVNLDTDLAYGIRNVLAAENLDESDIEAAVRFLVRPDVIGFFKTGMNVYNELAVAGEVNGDIEYRRIDRLMVGEGHVWIVDYKTGVEQQETHREQVKAYAAIVKPLYPDSAISGFLLYIDLGIVVEVPC